MCIGIMSRIGIFLGVFFMGRVSGVILLLVIIVVMGIAMRRGRIMFLSLVRMGMGMVMSRFLVRVVFGVLVVFARLVVVAPPVAFDLLVVPGPLVMPRFLVRVAAFDPLVVHALAVLVPLVAFGPPVVFDRLIVRAPVVFAPQVVFGPPVVMPVVTMSHSLVKMKTVMLHALGKLLQYVQCFSWRFGLKVTV